MLEIRNLTKTYGDFKALDNVSFTIDPGERVALLGANGSGKTTTVRAICRLLEWESGQIQFNGEPIQTQKSYLTNIGAVLEGSRDLNWRLNAQQNAQYYSGLRQVSAQVSAPLIDQTMNRLGLTQYGSRTVGRLSTGNRQKTALLCALIHKPKLLLLDEPTLGLDLETIEELEKVLLDLVVENGQSLLITSHDMKFIENICSRVILLETGKMVFDGSIDELKRELFHYELLVELNQAEWDQVNERVNQLFSGSRINAHFTDAILEVQYDEPNQVFPLINWLSEAGVAPKRLSISELSLEKAYKHMLSTE